MPNVDLTCETCNAEPAIGVASIPGIPMSVAYGRACLEANAHPVWALVANTACVGGLEHAADWWRQMVTDTLAHLSIPQADFDRQVEDALRDEREGLGNG